MTIRLVVLAACLTGAGLWLDGMSQQAPVPLRESFATLPYAFGPWNGVEEPDFDRETLALLGVDDYVNRVYARPREAPVGLYVGYYQSQRHGDTIHSPLNCLPGGGWEPVSQRRIAVPLPGRPAPAIVNSFVIQKGLDRLVVLYWYQSHGRIVASEYLAKGYMFWDAVETSRTDGALVRVTSPIVNLDDGSEQAAERRAVELVQTLFPLLGRHLPS